MKKYLLCFTACLAALLMPAAMTLAQSGIDNANIQYPVAELGNCADKAACKAYCDLPQNAPACLEFAGKNSLMSAQELQEAEKFLALGGKGPGGCADKAACETYCDDTRHTAECVKFAVENGLLSGQELDEAKKMLAALEKGITPPACGSKKNCDAYCEDPYHMEECVNFAIQAGFISGKELEDAQKMLAAIKKGATPPKCNGKEQCDAYCQSEEHFAECADFAVAAGFMSAEDAAMARKTGGKGPGGCKNKEECDAFCNNPANQETCFQFGVDNGLISPDDLKKMEEGKKMMQQSLSQAPAEVIACLQGLVGAEMVEKMKAGTAAPSQNTGDQVRQCFEKFMPMGPQNNMGPQTGQGGFPGPGGCKNEDECKKYCLTNPDECKNFKAGPAVAPEGTVPGSQAAEKYDIIPGTTPSIGPGTINQPQTGPGGCDSPESCEAYCQAHQEECARYDSSRNGQAGGNTYAPGTQPGTPGTMQPGQIMAGPGGCKSEEECRAYCQANPDACKNFTAPGAGTATPDIKQQIMAPPMPMGQPGDGGNTYAPGTAPGTAPGQPQYGTQPGMELNRVMETSQYPNAQPPMPPAGMEGQQPQQPQTNFTPPPADGGGSAPPPSSRLDQNPLLAALAAVFHYFFPF